KELRSLVTEYLGTNKGPNATEKAQQRFEALKREGFSPIRIKGDIATLEFALHAHGVEDDTSICRNILD
ncbi:hypothetical protein BGZ54_001442, partial [Gamsiella multidivaricata]